jgi:hypothetical protein
VCYLFLYVSRAFTRDELLALVLEAGYEESSLSCSYSGDGWFDFVDPCRMACTLDLRTLERE